MTVILLRHGRSTSNTAHTLAGRSEGVELDDKGHAQAAALADRVAGLDAIVRLPLASAESARTDAVRAGPDGSRTA